MTLMQVDSEGHGMAQLNIKLFKALVVIMKLNDHVDQCHDPDCHIRSLMSSIRRD